jgi:hypothetical protein
VLIRDVVIKPCVSSNVSANSRIECCVFVDWLRGIVDVTTNFNY